MFDTQQLHFYECIDENLFLTEIEIEDWLDYIKIIVNDDSKSPQYRMQKVIDSITKEY